MTPPTDGLLSGLRVLEFGHIAAGPFAGSLFADLGADVVKVERPGSGDGMRGWPPLTENEHGVPFSENFASLNRNKRSIVVDMKDDDEVARLHRLCARTDVIIENFRPGTLARLGFGYDDLAEDNPGLVYCSLSGYGQSGPYAERGAFDVTVQAMSGVMSVTGEKGGAPVKCGVPVGDFCAGLYGSFTVLAVIAARERTGRGAHIDCSMLGSLLGISALQTSEYFGTGRAQTALGSAHPRNAPYQAFKGSDVPFAIAAGNDKLWAQVCDATGLPELLTDPRFETQLSRAEHQEELAEILQEVFDGQTAAYWIAEMDRRGVPCAPINTFPDVLSDPHVEYMGLVQPLRLPNGVDTRTVTYPVKVTGEEFGIFSAPPPLGGHNDDVFRDWLGE